MLAVELVTKCNLPVQVGERVVVAARVNAISGRVMVEYADGGEDDLGSHVQINLTPNDKGNLTPNPSPKGEVR